MNQHLTLLRAVVEISPILALRSLFHWEGEYSSEAGGLRTIHETETRSAIYAGESSTPCVTASFAGESVDLQVNAALPDDLNYCLAALGLGRGKSPATLRMDSENLHDRVLTVDAAWVLLRRLRLDAPDVDAAKAACDIIQLANDWNLVRLEHFNNGESPALERRESELRQRAATLCTTLPLQEVSFRPDPRGAALELRFRGSHDFSLAPLRFDWPFGGASVSLQAHWPMELNQLTGQSYCLFRKIPVIQGHKPNLPFINTTSGVLRFDRRLDTQLQPNAEIGTTRAREGCDLADHYVPVLLGEDGGSTPQSRRSE